MKLQGKFVVIEGTDGSGKGTQSNMLVDWLKAEGADVELFDFPRYGEPSAYFVERYLTGAYGDLAETGPHRGSLFYALDRFEASAAIRAALVRGSIVIANRYVGSNMAHQGGKLDTPAERQKYFEWNDNLEYEILGIPRPDLNVVLKMPAEIAQKLVDQKAHREYIKGQKRDIHEANLDHLARSVQTYDELCALFPDKYTKIECHQAGKLRSIENIQSEIRALVATLTAPIN